MATVRISFCCHRGGAIGFPLSADQCRAVLSLPPVTTVTLFELKTAAQIGPSWRRASPYCSPVAVFHSPGVPSTQALHARRAVGQCNLVVRAERGGRDLCPMAEGFAGGFGGGRVPQPGGAVGAPGQSQLAVEAERRAAHPRRMTKRFPDRVP